ncbi:type II toxin-antitoxin system Phd/YefM family antitoxin [Streptomyces sp. NBC_01022]|uniref:type II toxin-antitoxin system Phd/YefM family antitoxin n=1 Tax=Streptomyces sp. NBC_01022 TaxID=2903723 RepID=UPI002DD88A5C|nr:PhdYeFM domain-containing protein [Streptomyces sp. NBC_01022]WRZ87234.1 PhdYeFM domain-containing protein [Streptomyces sp. NBC_01022]
MTEQELCANFADVMNAVEAGEVFRITRDGLEMAELSPLRPARRPGAEELVTRHRLLPRVDSAVMRREGEEFFGPGGGA